ncbi:hypothetical protein BT96DRAFT_532743 [Gymnopus androsaceus JB14]|uniref:Uncharacterized protein n=1 Tax=Gymnopus androsaceus JB14 TaxID=1447944 RepID=A0A6A4IMN7_9AGAR|nr:hypothetical protein BT96DRAFT_532743 [Gymnopus androsaceus JB14]
MATSGRSLLPAPRRMAFLNIHLSWHPRFVRDGGHIKKSTLSKVIFLVVVPNILRFEVT